MWKETEGQHLHSLTFPYNALYVYALSVLILSMSKARFANPESEIRLKTSVIKPWVVKSTDKDLDPQIILKHAPSSVTQNNLQIE
jgi:hypothetical protein